ncbi:MAG TPA: c-type cytochrome, partial [Stellaceae bacterium]|nr:c-type cytochrome [Stellaceae bacterium]
ILLVPVLAAVALYRAFVPGLSSARNEPSGLEVTVATWLLHRSVPDEARAAANPLEADPAELAAGRDLFRRKCESCHAYDGGGQTEIGGAVYPRAPSLRGTVAGMSDGEIFYHIRNGIRNTAMPAWSLPDRQIWELVLYLRHLPQTANLVPEPAPPKLDAHYVGSKACEACHAAIYARWQKTPMANVVRDPREHPEAILPDFSKPDPLLTFSKDDIAFVYGSRWKQRYFTKRGDDYFPEPAQWDVTHQVWRKYFVPNGGDWWAALYPPDNFQRPTGPLCDGCHSVNYDIATKSVSEWNVGCERCHGPGSAHVAAKTAASIINPAGLDHVHANDVCIQCHSQGQPLTNPIAGKYYDWPVGFHVGLDLQDFWKLEEHKPGQASFTHFADGTAHKNRMQGNDFVESLMYRRGVTCFSCHDVHGTPYPANLRKPTGEICLDCHGVNSQNGPHAASLESHTHHAAGSTGSQCIACHMPAIEETIADVKVHAHTFQFITPAKTESLKVPNPCTLCHTEKTPQWAADALKHWSDRSPWRMSE